MAEINQMDQLVQALNETSVERTSISSDDILSLINSSLERGEPFATEFTERVIKPLARKIESKLYVSSIEVDGASIGKHITDVLKEQSNDTIKESAKSLNRQLKPALDLKNLDLSEILIGKANKIDKGQISNLRTKLLNTIKTNIDDIVKNSTQNKGFNISSLFSNQPKYDRAARVQFNNVRRKLLKSIENHSSDIIKSAVSVDKPEGIPLSMIFGIESTTSFTVKRKFRKAQKALLNKVAKYSDEIVRSVAAGEIKLDLNSIFGVPPNLGFFNRMRFAQLQKKLLKSLNKQMLSVGQVDESKNKDDTSREESTPGSKFRSLLENKKEITIGGFSKPALKQLAGLMPSVAAATTAAAKTGPELLDGLLKSKLMASILPILGGAGIILGGLAALVGGIATSGPMKGVLKLIGKGGLALGLKVIGKKIGKVLISKGLKRIPIIGSLISIAFAVSRFRKGDITGGILDLVSGLVGFLDLVAPGIGTTLSLGVDALSAYLDIKAGGASKEASKKKFDILKTIGAKIGTTLKKVIRFVPGIGTIIRLMEAFGEIKRGQLASGLLSIASAMAVIAPGIGTLIAGAIDIFKSKQEKEAELQQGTEKKTFLQEINNWLIDKIKRSSIYRLGSGLIRIFKGERKKGLIDIAKVIGSQPIIGKPFLALVSLLTSTDLTVENVNIPKQKSFFTILKEQLKQDLIDKFKKAPKWMQGMMKRLPGLSGILKDVKDVNILDDEKTDIQVIKPGRPAQTVNTGINDAKSIAAVPFKTGIQKEEKSQPLKVEVIQKKEDLHIIQQNKEETTYLRKQMQQLTQSMQDFLHLQKQDKTSNITQQGVHGNLPPVESSDRDPAYLLRARVWDRLRSGVIIT